MKIVPARFTPPPVTIEMRPVSPMDRLLAGTSRKVMAAASLREMFLSIRAAKTSHANEDK